MSESIEFNVNSGCGPSSEEPTPPDAISQVENKLHVGFAAMDPERQREIARAGGIERGRRMHEASKHTDYHQ